MSREAAKWDKGKFPFASFAASRDFQNNPTKLAEWPFMRASKTFQLLFR
jgi:hypothetical protein